MRQKKKKTQQLKNKKVARAQTKKWGPHSWLFYTWMGRVTFPFIVLVNIKNRVSNYY